MLPRPAFGAITLVVGVAAGAVGAVALEPESVTPKPIVKVRYADEDLANRANDAIEAANKAFYAYADLSKSVSDDVYLSDELTQFEWNRMLRDSGALARVKAYFRIVEPYMHNWTE